MLKLGGFKKENMKGLIENAKTQALAESAIKIIKLENLLNLANLEVEFWKNKAVIETTRSVNLQFIINKMKDDIKG